MQSEILNSVSEDLFSIPPLIFRGIRRKLVKTALAHINMDISPLHFEIMRLLQEAGALHVAEIGQRLQIARPQMTHLLDKLVDSNIVERQADITDRRSINIRLTNKGRSVLEEHNDSIRNVIMETLSCLTDEELEDLSASLRKLRDMFAKLQ